jgi:hypothetical protein
MATLTAAVWHSNNYGRDQRYLVVTLAEQQRGAALPFKPVNDATVAMPRETVVSAVILTFSQHVVLSFVISSIHFRLLQFRQECCGSFIAAQNNPAT